ncbi:hypothetical protein FOA52_011393 [Chlamydomonas sp. UWO 241]|nr:hypothetical protein FOA52_011393 [Chlamydomonas sp. UWO 241]
MQRSGQAARSVQGVRAQASGSTPRLGRAHIGAACRRPATLRGSNSAAFGQRTTFPTMHVTVQRRGTHVIVCAALAGVEKSTGEVKALLDLDVKPEQGLVVGQLDNGFRYVILPNKLPPTRFEAHLEVHAGSVDEGVDEQGIAHLVEHVTFLGSKRRENLLGSGARANAYTDFHHTVFHVHAPVTNNMSGGKMLPQVLEALEDIAFRPEFELNRIEKERKAVLAEAQMMNTIEYRVDCQLLQYLHEENNLGCRFPIGKTEQVKQWPAPALKKFWEKWYFPANATLYVVGDLDRDVSEVRALIEKTFGKLPAASIKTDEVRALEALDPNEHGPAPATLPPPAEGSNGVDSLIKARHPVRPPVGHMVGWGPLRAGERPAEVKIFRHPLLHHYMLSIFCKLPISPMTTMEHLRQAFMVRTLLSVFRFRLQGRYMAGTPPFIAIDLDISNSGREGCAVSTLTITAEPRDWAEATAIGVQEVRRLQRHGLTSGEFERYRTAILRDSSQLAEQANKIPSLDTLNFVMESLACDHTVMGHRDAHDAMTQVAATITLEEMNAIVRSMLTFASDYGSEGKVLDEAAADPSKWAHLGPTRATSVVACMPAYVDPEGQSVGAGASGPARASLGADGHLDADAIDLAALEAQARALDEFEVPEGAIRFDVSADDIAKVMASSDLEVEPVKDVTTPRHLIEPADVVAMAEERRPSFVPLGGEGAAGSATPEPDAFSGITQRRLSNGIRINYRKTDNEPKAALMRVIANGGRAAERMGTGPDGFGAVVVGTRALSEVGTVGSWPREQTESFCIANLIDCQLEADEENIVFDVHFAVGEGDTGLCLPFELVHLMLEQPQWDGSAMDRAKQMFLSSGRSVQKSLERATAERIMNAMFGTSERRFRDPSPSEIDALTLEGMQKSVLSLFHPSNIEIDVVGDFDAAELEACLLKFIGTVSPRDPALVAPITHVTADFLAPPFEQRHSVWHLRDSDERAAAYVGGPAPARWGPFGDYGPLGPHPDGVDVKAPPVFVPATAQAERKKSAAELRRRHPLYTSVTLMLLTEIVNSRLFTTVRDTLGLTYDVSFEVTLFDRVRAGWYSVHVTSHPDKIYDALNASVAVLRDIAVSPINRRELERARTTTITRHESDMKDNSYWVGLLTHLQNDSVPHKTLQCLRDLKIMYEAITVEDIYHLYNNFNFDDNHIFTCVGISGRTAPEVPENYLTGSASSEDEAPAAAPAGPSLSPASLFTALMAAAQSMNIKSAMKQAGGDKGSSA